MFWIDILTIIVGLLLIYQSYKKGLITSAIRFVGLILGILVSANLGAWAGDILSLSFNMSKHTADIIGYIVIFVLVILVIQLVGYLLRSILNAIKLGWLDRFGGLLFGALKAGIILSLIFWLLMAIPTESLGKDIRERSFSYKLLGGFAPWLYETLVQPYIPESNIRDQLDSMLSPTEIGKAGNLNLLEEKLSGLQDMDSAYVEGLETKFKKLSLEQQKLIISELSKNEPDLQRIIEILYSSPEP